MQQTAENILSQGQDNYTREVFNYYKTATIAPAAGAQLVASFQTQPKAGRFEGFLFDFSQFTPATGTFQIQLLLDQKAIPNNDGFDPFDWEQVLGQFVDFSIYFDGYGQHKLEFYLTNSGLINIFPIFRVTGHYFLSADLKIN